MEQKAPGLRWIKRPNGTREAYWYATKEAVGAGFELKTVRLVGAPDLRLRCQQLQAEMLDWLNEQNGGELSTRFEGPVTVKSLIELYQTHPDSSYRKLKASSREPYTMYARKLIRTVGHRQISTLTGLDIIRWHEGWRGQNNRIGAAAMAFAVLKAALRFGAICRLNGCHDILVMARELRLPSPKPRTQAPTAADIEAARAAAHALKRPRAALGYALQFEATLRAWDVIGQWVPLDDPRPSAIIWRGKKWFGPTWAMIENQILTITPTKTEHTTGKRVTLDLSEMPMVMEEIRCMTGLTGSASDFASPYGCPPSLFGGPPAHGPIVINERTGFPYTTDSWMEFWRRVRKKAGLSTDLWNRDIRAGGVTEGGRAGASSDDRAKVAGHSRPKHVREVYDRDVLDGARRVAQARKAFREGEK